MVDNERLQDINKHPYPDDLAVHAQSMIFYVNRNQCQHGSRAWRMKIISLIWPRKQNPKVT